MNYRAALIISIIFLFSGCSSTQSTASGGGDKTAPRVFLLSTEQAEKILATAMYAQFSDVPISRVDFPNKGYKATVGFLLDSHTIVAYMIAAKGRSVDGTVKPGFAFEVSNAGTMPLSGGSRAGDLFQRLMRDASVISPAVPLVSF